MHYFNIRYQADYVAILTFILLYFVSFESISQNNHLVVKGNSIYDENNNKLNYDEVIWFLRDRPTALSHIRKARMQSTLNKGLIFSGAAILGTAKLIYNEGNYENSDEDKIIGLLVLTTACIVSSFVVDSKSRKNKRIAIGLYNEAIWFSGSYNNSLTFKAIPSLGVSFKL